MDRPEVVEILEMKKESKHTATLRLAKKIDAVPGQFVMLWIPNVDEKPFGLSKIGKEAEITFEIKGNFTQKLASLGKGDKIGVRGPYGRGWDMRGKKVCIVAGGLGIAPLMPIIEDKKTKKTLIFGVKSKDKLILQDRLKKSGAKTFYTTDDGSFGEHCFACDLLEKVIGTGCDQILTCGPEAMMKAVVDIATKLKIPCQLSMERYMKCGIGICGSCCIDPKGLMVCKDGPVFWSDELGKGEFGVYTRDKSGSKIRF
ncbi:MAG: dihydroorotate dehydrogenase electron transfer subunit [Candidatus Altiarchaeota archaeon]|nr:dihydroorotate dehydrogenase electron transfer subunit [Candidatus Altiarchaeota archaeon]